MIKARSQECAAGGANLSWRNHVVHCLRAHFILYIITIKWIMCLQEKIELSSVTKTKIELNQKFQEISS